MHSGRKVLQLLLYFGVGVNLAAICLFKYSGFLAGTLNRAAGLTLPVPSFILPLAISFFTFQQIAFLVDVAAGRTEEPDLLRYTLFVVFFPQLIAGPIVQHKEIAPQLDQAYTSFHRKSKENLQEGLFFFVSGLAKKLIIADFLGGIADPVFSAAAGGMLPAAMAWTGLAAYAFQLYFDFSGYSDMAVGLAALFGVHIPYNFDSPYKAVSISDFWKRWHITLGSFFRHYLYFPLGGSRCGRLRAGFNLWLTMTLCGLWHGAGWTFVLWGMYHGFLLILGKVFSNFSFRIQPHQIVSRAVTFFLVFAGWGIFRSTDIKSMLNLFISMSGLGRTSPAADSLLSGINILFIAGAAAIAWILPNTQEIKHYFKNNAVHPALTAGGGFIAGAAIAVVAARFFFKIEPAAFLYYNF